MFKRFIAKSKINCVLVQALKDEPEAEVVVSLEVNSTVAEMREVVSCLEQEHSKEQM